MKKFIGLTSILSFFLYTDCFFDKSPEATQAWIQFVDAHGGLYGAACQLFSTRDIVEEQRKECKQRLKEASFLTAHRVEAEYKKTKKKKKQINKLINRLCEEIIFSSHTIHRGIQGASQQIVKHNC